jgi:hypothetical protein
MALQFEARKVSLKQDRGGFLLTLSLHPDEIPEELFRDFVGARYACAFVRIQDDEQPTPYNNRVKKAGMLCRDIQFHQFLVASNFMNEEGEQGAINALCSICNMESRTELNGNEEAKNLFDELLKHYEEWKFNDDPFK